MFKEVLNSATGCVVYSEHNQYQGKKCSPEAAVQALEKFSFAKLVEQDGGRFVVHVHDRCWFELEHGQALPSTCRRCGGEVTTAGEGNLRYTGCEVCGEPH
jgi:hypothetical protein